MPIAELKTKLKELAHLASTAAVLEWDNEVNVPPLGRDARAEMVAYIAGLRHEKFTAPEFETILLEAESVKKLTSEEQCIVREARRDFDKAKKLPSNFIRELAQVCANSTDAWRQAKQLGNFKIFQPHLEKIVDLKIKEAEYLGYQESPYDALLDNFEPGMTAREVERILGELREFLPGFIQQIKKSHSKIPAMKAKALAEKQIEFGREVVAQLGYDFDAGAFHISEHPFCTSFHPYDVRLTARHKPNDPVMVLYDLIHEAGHGMYGQGLLAEHYGTPLSEPVSFAIDESQSRFWENMIGRSRAFWQYWYPKFQKTFPEPFAKISLNDFYRSLNKVKPGLIRIDADEVTYNLHIMIRFEIEKMLIERQITVAEAPKIWNQKTEQYLGITVPDDGKGILQDIHWADGLFGYFPTYAIGNIYAAQLWAAMRRDIKSLDQKIAKGQFAAIREWLREKIHIHGRMYAPVELIRRATGEVPTSKYLIEYLIDRYRL